MFVRRVARVTGLTSDSISTGKYRLGLHFCYMDTKRFCEPQLLHIDYQVPDPQEMWNLICPLTEHGAFVEVYDVGYHYAAADSRDRQGRGHLCFIPRDTVLAIRGDVIHAGGISLGYKNPRWQARAFGVSEDGKEDAAACRVHQNTIMRHLPHGDWVQLRPEWLTSRQGKATKL